MKFITHVMKVSANIGIRVQTGETRSFLRSFASTSCYDDAHRRLLLLSTGMMLLWPIGCSSSTMCLVVRECPIV